MEFLLVLFVIFTGSYILGEVLFRYFKLPKVIGPIVFGFVLNFPFIKPHILPAGSPALGVLVTFKEIAIIFLLFFVGLKIDLRGFVRSSKRSFAVASAAFFLPFGLGYFATRILGFDNFTSIVVAACLSVSAEAVSVEILEEMKLLKTKMGEVIIEAGLIDDFFGIFTIAIITTLLTTEVGLKLGLAKILLEIAIFVFVIIFIRIFVVGKVLTYAEDKHNKIDLFATSLIITLFMAALASYLELGTVMGAVIAGVLIRHTLLEEKGIKSKEEMIKDEHDITEVIEITTFGFLAPFFFVLIGLETDLSILWTNPVFVLALLAIGVIGKVFGSRIGNYFGGGDRREGRLIGWAMNTRGAVELIIATIALDHGLITKNLYSALIFMAFVTTIISPIMFKRLVKEHHYKHGLH